jgi:hypothetical protein
LTAARTNKIVTGGTQPNVPVAVPRVVVPIRAARTGVRAISTRAAYAIIASFAVLLGANPCAKHLPNLGNFNGRYFKLMPPD